MIEPAAEDEAEIISFNNSHGIGQVNSQIISDIIADAAQSGNSNELAEELDSIDPGFRPIANEEHRRAQTEENIVRPLNGHRREESTGNTANPFRGHMRPETSRIRKESEEER